MLIGNRSIRFKIILFFSLSALLTCLLVGGTLTLVAKSSLKKVKIESMEAIRESKIIEINNIFNGFSSNIKTISLLKYFQDAVWTTESIVYSTGLDPVAGDVVLDIPEIEKNQNKYAEDFKDIIDQYKIKNFYAVINSGVVVTQAFSDVYKGKNLKVGSKKDSLLAKAFQAGQTEIAFTDLAYCPDLKKTVAYMSMPVLSKFDRAGYNKNDVLGILIVELDWDIVNSISKFKVGLGSTGEIYILGKDQILRTDNKSDKYLNAHEQKTLMDTKVFNFQDNLMSGVSEVKNYDNVNIYRAHSIIDVMKTPMALIVEIASKEVNAASSTMVQIILIIILIVIAVVCIAGMFIGRNIANPLLRLTRELEKASEDVLKISEAITTGGQHIASSSNQQAAATQESVAAIEEMSSMISQTNQFSGNSQKLIKDVELQAHNGNSVMDELSNSMNLIQQANDQLERIGSMIDDISKETTVINEIVFKTQLLSFNASIEAARAGVLGKGFSVVAEEVGNLAQTSGEAAQKIYELLSKSKKQVDAMIEDTKFVVSQGRTSADKAIEIFREIDTNISSINSQVEQIFSASKEQANGISQTKDSMKQLDLATISNSNMANQALANAASLGDANMKFISIIGNLKGIVLGSMESSSKQTDLDPRYNYPDNDKDKDDHHPLNFPFASNDLDVDKHFDQFQRMSD